MMTDTNFTNLQKCLTDFIDKITQDKDVTFFNFSARNSVVMDIECRSSNENSLNRELQKNGTMSGITNIEFMKSTEGYCTIDFPELCKQKHWKFNPVLLPDFELDQDPGTALKSRQDFDRERYQDRWGSLNHKRLKIAIANAHFKEIAKMKQSNGIYYVFDDRIDILTALQKARQDGTIKIPPGWKMIIVHFDWANWFEKFTPTPKYVLKELQKQFPTQDPKTFTLFASHSNSCIDQLTLKDYNSVILQKYAPNIAHIPLFRDFDWKTFFTNLNLNYQPLDYVLDIHTFNTDQQPIQTKTQNIVLAADYDGCWDILASSVVHRKILYTIIHPYYKYHSQKRSTNVPDK